MAPPTSGDAVLTGEAGFAAAPLEAAPARNVGILAMEMYFPSTYLEQTELGACPRRGRAARARGAGARR